MKYRFHINALSKLIAILVCFSLIQMAQAKDLVRLTAGEWVPYISETLDHKGLISQITEEAFALQNIEMKLGIFPWERAYQLSKSGLWDGTIALSKTTEREKNYLFSDPIYTGKYVFFHLKSTSVKWQNYNDLSKLRIGAARGFGGMGQEFLSAEENKIIKVDRVTTMLQAFNMLLLGRVQLVPSDLEVGYVLLNQNFDKKKIEQITHNNHVIQLTKYHLVMTKASPKSADLINKFNLGLKTLKKSGRYNQIIKEFYQKKIYQDFLPADYLTSEMNGLRKNYP
ncbi:transporter substrate-binding domain-containing protein [Bacteriovorax sp. PP10]|uniref:Transporter substrate-binding domain-containing protein n=1 Tax=Bacteriovorax antarcticus TaxID=3088717 RepID=A0ABU5VT65_9BACT|nr:transporter substrate-binding domain-containing protein [Bacteriovorax sp. PP10]MEA9356238.1 transporter substrate-binding domain-containing protein [Bacteriovorax sp. PP10]